MARTKRAKAASKITALVRVPLRASDDHMRHVLSEHMQIVGEVSSIVMCACDLCARALARLDKVDGHGEGP